MHFYPKIKLIGRNFILSIFPEYHTQLFPDSKLKTETENAVVDKKYANSKSKVYLSGALQANDLKPNDILLIYRTKDDKTSSPAYYSSVATSVCVVTEIKNIQDFTNDQEFINYCNNTSVYDENKLKEYWRSKKYKTLVKIDYYFPLTKRITRAKIIELCPRIRDERWTLLSITDSELRSIINEAGDTEFIQTE